MSADPLRTEVELKLELPPASLRRVSGVPLIKRSEAAPESTTEVSVYFDTDRRKLLGKGLALRLRQIGARHFQTIETNDDLDAFRRNEWEAEIASAEPDLSLPKGGPLARLANGKLLRRLEPIFKTRVRRTFYRLAADACDIALVVDHGAVNAGRRSAPLCEIGLKLIRGKVGDLFEVARELAGPLPARIIFASQARRGYDLVDGKQDQSVKAVPIVLAADVTTRDAFKVIGLACLRQIVDNVPALMMRDPEGVHQMRVGLRRLRAAMSSFSGLLDDAQSSAIRMELKWLAGELGPARELEVLLNRVVTPTDTRHVQMKGVPSFTRELTKQREAAVERARAGVASTRFRRLTLETAAWLEAGHWSMPRSAAKRDQGDVPAATFATAQLRRRWRRLRKKRKIMSRLGPRELHKIRIQAKKLRYAIEFFASLFAGKDTAKRLQRLLSVLERLQDGLGDLNDIAVDEQRLTDMGIRHRSSSRRAFAAGLLTGREDARIDAAMTAVSTAYAELIRITPFWE